MLWACFHAPSSALPSILIGVSAQRHSNAVGGATNGLGSSAASVGVRQYHSDAATSAKTTKEEMTRRVRVMEKTFRRERGVISGQGISVAGILPQASAGEEGDSCTRESPPPEQRTKLERRELEFAD